ncbi:MAG: ribonuclease PH [Phycisphaerae bacterium]|nr:ribonuclease PH [Phycisphaerae bacterium]
MAIRADGRAADELRPVRIQRGFLDQPAGAVLIEFGATRVLCTASIEEGVPEWRETSGKGWVTAEYDMLPAATGRRRERNRTKVDGRTQEIQRLIGRSLRAIVDMSRLGTHTLWLDCDVLQADGGTRTASITGAYVALVDALRLGEKQGRWDAKSALQTQVAAISAGIVDGATLLDLNYREDSAADVDCNLVMTGRGEWVEVQATGEGGSFSQQQLSELTALGERCIRRLFEMQAAALVG